MPLIRVPVVHKFGIISQTHRLQLQNRLLLQNQPPPEKLTTWRNDLEITDEFIKQYNEALTSSDKELQQKLHSKSEKMLERVKRKLGVKDGAAGTGCRVDLPVAWTDLSLLAQCYGQLQEESLALLINSLDQSPFETSHIPVLFYLAESALYWLRTDTVHRPFITTNELQLLTMGRLVFTRLCYHHMAGQMNREIVELKTHLSTYLDGFNESQVIYSPYPEALLCLRFMCEVGRIIVGDCRDRTKEEQGPHIVPTTDVVTEHDEEVPILGARNSHVISTAIHELSPCLWHALDVWRCTVQLGAGLQSALDSLVDCGSRISADNWVDVVSAFEILADAAKVNLLVLDILQHVARGRHSAGGPAVCPDHILSSNRNSDETTEPGTSPADRLSGNVKPSTTPQRTKRLSVVRESYEAVDQKTLQQPSDGSRLPDVARSHDEEQSATNTGLEYTNIPRHGLFGLHGWHWEVAVVYVNMMSEISLHGTTSVIQKRALIGSNVNAAGVHMTSAMVYYPLPSTGLVDLVFFHALEEHEDGGPEDWSWRVRYAALQGLAKVCRGTAGNPMKDGLRNIAWSVLMKASKLERDTRVLEAIRVMPFDVSLEQHLSSRLLVQPLTLGAKVAAGLSHLYLPPLPPPVVLSTSPRSHRPTKSYRKQPTAVVGDQSPRQPATNDRKLHRKTSQPVGNPRPTFENRTSKTLLRIVADQWKKELLEADEEAALKRTVLATDNVLTEAAETIS